MQQVNEVFKNEEVMEGQRRIAEIIADIDIWNRSHSRFIMLSLQFIKKCGLSKKQDLKLRSDKQLSRQDIKPPDIFCYQKIYTSLNKLF